MKKIFVFAAVALTALFSACQNVETEQAPVGDEIVLSLSAEIGDPGTRTVFVPEGGKVNWVEGDKINARYPAANGKFPCANLALYSGAGTTNAVFTGKISNTSSFALAANPSDFVFYYPAVTPADDKGTVTDADNYTLNNKFPKVQSSADILFEPNWMVGSVKAQEFVTTLNQTDTAKFGVTMKNLMAVLDFTVKGDDALKRIFVTDLDASASALYGPEELTVENGAVKSLVLTGAGTNEYDRTIIAEFNKPINLSEEGTHIYVTIFPRTYAKGLRVAFESYAGEMMIKNLAETEGFTLTSGKVYTVPELTFAPTSVAGKGYYDGVEYSYESFVDPRDNNEYFVATLKDGRTWMLSNLRYKPSGFTISGDLSAVNNGVWYPVVMKVDGTGVDFASDAGRIARFGLLYNFSTAMGKDPDYVYNLQKEVLAGTKTAAEAKAELTALNGTQGICPPGWHVPTNAEYATLYIASGQSMSGLGVQGFILKDVGALNIGNFTATSDPKAATFMGYANNKLNTCYYMLSSANSHTQIQGIMTNVTNNTAAVTNMNIRFGAPLRCIKDK